MSGEVCRGGCTDYVIVRKRKWVVKVLTDASVHVRVEWVMDRLMDRVVGRLLTIR